MVDLARFSPETLALLQRAKAIACAAQQGTPTAPAPLHLAQAILSRDERGLHMAALLAAGDQALRVALEAALVEPPHLPPVPPVAPPAATLAVLAAAQRLAEAASPPVAAVEPIHLCCAVLSCGDAALRAWLAERALSPLALAAAARQALGAFAAAAEPVLGQQQDALASAPGSAAGPGLPAASVHPLPETARRLLGRFCTDLTAAAQAGKLRPAVGRDALFDRLCEQLLRLGKRNVVLTGEGGVGKTCLATHLAWTLAHAPQALPGAIRDCVVYSLDLLRLRMGGGVVGELEARTRDLIATLEAHADRVILFVDELHIIVGSPVGGAALDLANALKPLLAEGRVRCIGATTPTEYNRYIAADPALARRFAEIRVPPLTPPETLVLLRAERERFARALGGVIDDEALRAVVNLALRHLPNRRFPDKALDLLDAACAHAAFVGTDHVTAGLVKAVLARDLDLPAIVDADISPAGIEAALNRIVVGQGAACAAIARALIRGLRLADDHAAPRAVLLFTGPSRVGKTLAAEAVARILCARPEQFLRLDMGEFTGPPDGHSAERAVHRLIGPPPPYVGYERGGLLTNQLAAYPRSVILLDEFEKAALPVQDIFLGMFDRGTVLDGLGREVSCRDCYVMLTANTPFGAHSGSGGGALQASAALRPEFMRRLSAVVAFAGLGHDALHELARRAWGELQRDSLSRSGVGLRAVPDLDALANAVAAAALRAREAVPGVIGFAPAQSQGGPARGDARLLSARFQSSVADPVRDLLAQLEDEQATPDWITVRLLPADGDDCIVEAAPVSLVPRLLWPEADPAAAALARRLPRARPQPVPPGTSLAGILDRLVDEEVPILAVPAPDTELARAWLAYRQRHPALAVICYGGAPPATPDSIDAAILHAGPEVPLERLEGYLAHCLARARALQRRQRLLALLNRFAAEVQDRRVTG